jgi:hypothetical protein
MQASYGGISTAIVAIALATACGASTGLQVDTSQEAGDGKDANNPDAVLGSDALSCAEIQEAATQQAASVVHAAQLDGCEVATDCWQTNFAGSCFECGLSMNKEALDAVMPLVTQACLPFFANGCKLPSHSCIALTLACVEGTCQHAGR